jgi:hypothetical protein
MYKLLTSYSILLILLNNFIDIRFINLHLLTYICLLGGIYVWIVKKKQIIPILYYKYEVDGILLPFFNIITHVVPFLYVWIYVTKNKNNLLQTYLVLLLYMCLLNPYKEYLIYEYNEKLLVTIYLLIFIFIFYVYY